MVDEMGVAAVEMWADWMVAWMVYYSVASKVAYLVLLSAVSLVAEQEESWAAWSAVETVVWKAEL